MSRVMNRKRKRVIGESLEVSTSMRLTKQEFPVIVMCLGIGWLQMAVQFWL